MTDPAIVKDAISLPTRIYLQGWETALWVREFAIKSRETEFKSPVPT